LLINFTYTNLTILKKKIIVIGAGVGGLCSAIRLSQKGHAVTLLESRNTYGGLAGGFKLGNFSFDAGPYILLDKPGLTWAMSKLDMSAEQELDLLPLKNIYSVLDENGDVIAFDTNINDTADRFEQRYKGSGQLYKRFVSDTFKVHQKIQPLTYKSHPGPWDVFKNGLLRDVPFLLKSLGSLLRASDLPEQIQKGIGIWTYIAGQSVDNAPGPMAFVPGLFHNIGSYYPKGGMQTIADRLAQKAIAVGVQLKYNKHVEEIMVDQGIIKGVITSDGVEEVADIVVSNAAALSTYISLLKKTKPKQIEMLKKLPLQSPGVCIYMVVKGKQPPYYIQFKLQGKGCIAFIQPAVVDETIGKDGWYPARLIAPLPHDKAKEMKEEGQRELIEALVRDSWWQTNIEEYKILHQRTSFEWGRAYNLYEDSMNPVMTSEFMRKGRIAHRSSQVKGLYLTGSSTHPGQWVSFCAVSGILAADCVLKDLADA
jgi:phytoene dehydrogenase-like protein